MWLYEVQTIPKTGERFLSLKRDSLFMYDVETLFEIGLIIISIILFSVNVFGGFYLIKKLKKKKWHALVGISFFGIIVFGIYSAYSYFYLNSLYLGYSLAILILCISIFGSDLMKIVVLRDSLNYETDLLFGNIASLYWISILIRVLIRLISGKKKE
jgi:hypothetical protein